MKSYRAIASDLIGRIASGDVEEGTFLPVERSLIQEYGVTRTTVRRALAEVIEQGHGKLVRNRGVVALKTRPPGTKAIGFVAGSSIVLRALYAKLNSTLLNMGYYLVHIDSQTIGLENALLFAQEHGFIGVFIWSFEGFPDSELLARVQEKMPIVALDHELGSFESDLVTFDYLGMAYESVAHLLESGRKRVAVTGMLDMLNTTHQRFSGYMKAMFAAGAQPDVRNYVFCNTSGYVQPNYDHLTSRLTATDRPDAIFVMQDEWVPGTIDAVFRCGLSVPEDVAIASIGDDVLVNVGGQGISTIHCDWEGFGLDALNLLLKRTREPCGERIHLVAKHQFVPGQFEGQVVHENQAQAYVVTRHLKAASNDRPVSHEMT